MPFVKVAAFHSVGRMEEVNKVRSLSSRLVIIPMNNLIARLLTRVENEMKKSCLSVPQYLVNVQLTNRSWKARVDAEAPRLQRDNLCQSHEQYNWIG